MSPGAKKGSTAPYAYAEAMLLEAGERQPRTLSNAFRKPAELRGNVSQEALRALTEHVTGLDQIYGTHEARAGFCVAGDSSYSNLNGAAQKSLTELTDWVKNIVVSGQA